MRRRQFLGIVGGAAAWPVVAQAPNTGYAQQQVPPVIGLLGPQPNSSPFGDAVIAGLRELGYFAGQNIRIESRWANGEFEQLAGLAADLVNLRANVLVTSLTQATLAAKKATTAIPIVMAGVGDPVAAGLIASLARPGGNVTGTASLIVDIVGKQIELLKEIAPNVMRFAVLWNPANSVFQNLQLRQVEIAARATGLQLQLLVLRVKEAFELERRRYIAGSR